MTSRWLQRRRVLDNTLSTSQDYLKEEDVSDLVKSVSFNNATRTLTLEHNDADQNGNATETSVQIPHTPTDNLVKNVTWDSNTRNLTIEKNSIYQTNSVLNIAHTPIPNVSNLIKTGSFDNATRMLALGHNDADENGQNASATLVQIPHTDLTNYYTKTQIDNFNYMRWNYDIGPNNVRLRSNYKVLWDQHSDKGIWMQDSTWVRFNARIYTESNYICTHGRVGAGTVNPGQPLHVSGEAYISSGMHVACAYWYNNYTDSQSDYLTNGGSVQANPPGLNFGVRCDQAIVCSYLVVTSDRRIKENIEDIVDDVSLKQLRLLKPKTYEYKDKFEKGDKRVIGFIAQEVKEVLPNAVKLDKRAIPNILQPCSVYNKSTNVLELQVETTDDLTDKTIQIYIKDSPYIVKVIRWTRQYIHVEKPDEMADFDGKNPVVVDGDEAIVYGEYVEDFHVLDKSAIFTISVAALQEIDKQVQALEKRIIALEQRL